MNSKNRFVSGWSLLTKQRSKLNVANKSSQTLSWVSPVSSRSFEREAAEDQEVWNGVPYKVARFALIESGSVGFDG